MNVSERPGVYTSYEVSSTIAAYGSGGAVGLAAESTSGKEGSCVAVSSYAEALSEFGGGDMTELVRVLLLNGAPLVYCAHVGNGGYKTAIDALMGVPSVKYMVCGSRSSSVHTMVKSALGLADENSKYRIAVLESEITDRAALVSAAQALGSEKLVLVSHHETGGTPGSVAAALCGLLASKDDPALPVNGAALTGLGAVSGNFSDADITLLVRGGVTPLECVSGELSVVRGVTTRSESGGAPDPTWRELTTILVVNSVIPQIRDSLRAKFARAKNNAQTRGAIRTQVIIQLEENLRREYIDSYGDVSVQPGGDDASVCVVSFSFTVAHGLNRIELYADVSI